MWHRERNAWYFCHIRQNSLQSWQNPNKFVSQELKMHRAVSFWRSFQRKVTVFFSWKFLCSFVRTHSARSAARCVEMTRDRTPQIAAECIFVFVEAANQHRYSYFGNCLECQHDVFARPGVRKHAPKHAISRSLPIQSKYVRSRHAWELIAKIKCEPWSADHLVYERWDAQRTTCGVENNNSASQIWSPCKSNFSENLNWPRKSTTESLFSCDTLQIKAGTGEPRTTIGTPSWLFCVDFKSGLDNKKWVSTENF